MVSKYAYFVWTIIMITSWLSLVLSIWLSMIADNHYFFFSVFWLICTAIVAVMPQVKTRGQ